MDNLKNLPLHVAIIMDGNGRWAESRRLPKIAGHHEGVKAAERVMKAAVELGIKYLTLYTFSTENWKRPKAEVYALFGMLEEYLNSEAEKLNKNNIKLNTIGNIALLPPGVKNIIEKVTESTKNNSGLNLILALNYGSRDEIINAVRMISRDVDSGKFTTEDIDEKLFSDYLYTRTLPDPDLVVRTSGEYRLSNFLLWQICYAELYITDKLWPDFDGDDLKTAVSEYGRRRRRFGG